MKKPEPAPSFHRIFSDPATIAKVLDAGTHPDFSQFMERANADYLYWDRFKQIYQNPALPVEQAWAYLSFVRSTKLKDIALVDTKKRPFRYWIPETFLKTLHELDQNAAGTLLVEDPVVHSQSRERFIISSLMEEAIASSQLEGAATTTEIAKEMLRSGRNPRTNAEKMIANNYATMKVLKKHIERPLSKEMILEFQTLLTKDIGEDPAIVGRFRNQDDRVHVTWDDGTVLHVPPPAGELEERIGRLCEFANSEDHHFIHPAIKAVILHFWLAYDHPFVDGNGRTARALFYWFMLKKGYWLMEYIAISRIIKKAPVRYARAYLYAESEGNDLTYFIHYHLKVIAEALSDFQQYLKRKTFEAQEARLKISLAEDLNNRQSQALYRILTEASGVLTIQQHMNTFGVTYETARRDLLDLCRQGYLIQQKKGKQFIYTPADKLRKRVL